MTHEKDSQIMKWSLKKNPETSPHKICRLQHHTFRSTAPILPPDKKSAHHFAPTPNFQRGTTLKILPLNKTAGVASKAFGNFRQSPSMFGSAISFSIFSRRWDLGHKDEKAVRTTLKDFCKFGSVFITICTIRDLSRNSDDIV